MKKNIYIYVYKREINRIKPAAAMNSTASVTFDLHASFVPSVRACAACMRVRATSDEFTKLLSRFLFATRELHKIGTFGSFT
jgi:hypothetical protein